ncbi:unnamed protein product [Trichogramma brassicae]|uniref:Uncharacterized protein n=1 Tax=Trichogramma brassicae TaxID=86971 RepID=A0A6H5I0S7_9HYME|nr:unnamed protein product [Trichogramma brassicae]
MINRTERRGYITSRCLDVRKTMPICTRNMYRKSSADRCGSCERPSKRAPARVLWVCSKSGSTKYYLPTPKLSCLCYQPYSDYAVFQKQFKRHCSIWICWITKNNISEYSFTIVVDAQVTALGARVGRLTRRRGCTRLNNVSFASFIHTLRQTTADSSSRTYCVREIETAEQRIVCDSMALHFFLRTCADNAGNSMGEREYARYYNDLCGA